MPVLGLSKSGLLYSGGVQNLSPKNIVVPDGLVGFWGFDLYNVDRTALRVIDLSGNGKTGLLPAGSTTPTYTEHGVVGNAFNFASASHQYMDAGVFGLSALTYCAWINATTFPNAYTSVISKVESGAGVSTLLIKSTGKLAIYLQTTNTTLNYDGSGAFTLSTGTLYFLCLTYDSVTGLRGYVNAQLDASVAANGTVFNGGGNTGDDVWVGAHASFYGSRDFNGMIDEPRIYNRALQPSEIMDLYQAGLDGRRYAKFNQRLEMPILLPSLEHYWQLYVSKNSGAYEPIGGTTGVLPADASSDADETKILIPRL